MHNWWIIEIWFILTTQFILMKLASLLNNFLLCCTYNLLPDCRQWSKNRSQRRHFCVLLRQIRSGIRKFGRQSFPISMEANGKQCHRSTQHFGLGHSFVFLCKKSVPQTTHQQGQQRVWARGDKFINPWWFLQYLQPCEHDIAWATQVQRSQPKVNQPTAPNISPSSRRQRIIPGD